METKVLLLPLTTRILTTYTRVPPLPSSPDDISGISADSPIRPLDGPPGPHTIFDVVTSVGRNPYLHRRSHAHSTIFF